MYILLCNMNANMSCKESVRNFRPPLLGTAAKQTKTISIMSKSTTALALLSTALFTIEALESIGGPSQYNTVLESSINNLGPVFLLYGYAVGANKMREGKLNSSHLNSSYNKRFKSYPGYALAVYFVSKLYDMRLVTKEGRASVFKKSENYEALVKIFKSSKKVDRLLKFIAAQKKFKSMSEFATVLGLTEEEEEQLVIKIQNGRMELHEIAAQSELHLDDVLDLKRHIFSYREKYKHIYGDSVSDFIRPRSRGENSGTGRQKTQKSK